MTEQQTIDVDGLTNVAERIILQARKDFVKGGKVLFRLYGRIPEEQELLTNPMMYGMRNDRDVRWLYNSWRFVFKDPYDMFSDVNKSKVIEMWKEEAILAVYKEWYIPVAAILYRDTKSRKDPQEIAKSSVTKKVKTFYKEHDMENPKAVCEEFFKSREYVLKLKDALKIFYEWNEIAYERSRKPYKKYEGVGRKPIGQTAYAMEQMEQRRKNIKKAKELKEAGMSISDIAKHLGVTKPCVLAYLRT